MTSTLKIRVKCFKDVEWKTCFKFPVNFVIKHLSTCKESWPPQKWQNTFRNSTDKLVDHCMFPDRMCTNHCDTNLSVHRLFIKLRFLLHVVVDWVHSIVTNGSIPILKRVQMMSVFQSYVTIMNWEGSIYEEFGTMFLF